MSSASSFPHNIHRGIKLFFLATIFSLVVGIIAVVVALREANNAFVSGIVSYKTLKAISTISSVLSYCVMVLAVESLVQFFLRDTCIYCSYFNFNACRFETLQHASLISQVIFSCTDAEDRKLGAYALALQFLNLYLKIFYDLICNFLAA